MTTGVNLYENGARLFTAVLQGLVFVCNEFCTCVLHVLCYTNLHIIYMHI